MKPYDDLLKCCRGQLLIAIKTEISESIDTAPSEVEVEPTQTINEVSLGTARMRLIGRRDHNLITASPQACYNPREEFFLFATLMETSMVDRR